VWVYRTLVSHDSVPTWDEHSARGIAYHQHLYTQIAHGEESDATERWLAENVDGPSEPVLAKVASEQKLTAGDWGVLLRFFAASRARTPAYFLRRLPEWNRALPALMQGVLKNLIAAAQSGEPVRPTREAPMYEGAEVPSRVRVRANPDGDGGAIESEMLLGRRLWFFEIRQMVESTWRHLRRLNWTILRPPRGMLWLTSDDPAVVANISAPPNVTFDGKWDAPGSVLFLPLDPEHVLYGAPSTGLPRKYSVAVKTTADFVQNCLVRRAHRLVFAQAPQGWVPSVRERKVDAEAYRREREEWKNWHSVQGKAEEELEDDSTWHVPPST
jgi:hypothetical protein